MKRIDIEDYKREEIRWNILVVGIVLFFTFLLVANYSIPEMTSNKMIDAIFGTALLANSLLYIIIVPIIPMMMRTNSLMKTFGLSFLKREFRIISILIPLFILSYLLVTLDIFYGNLHIYLILLFFFLLVSTTLVGTILFYKLLSLFHGYPENSKLVYLLYKDILFTTKYDSQEEYTKREPLNKKRYEEYKREYVANTTNIRTQIEKTNTYPEKLLKTIANGMKENSSEDVGWGLGIYKDFYLLFLAESKKGDQEYSRYKFLYNPDLLNFAQQALKETDNPAWITEITKFNWQLLLDIFDSNYKKGGENFLDNIYLDPIKNMQCSELSIKEKIIVENVYSNFNQNYKGRDNFIGSNLIRREYSPQFLDYVSISLVKTFDGLLQKDPVPTEILNYTIRSMPIGCMEYEIMLMDHISEAQKKSLDKNLYFLCALGAYYKKNKYFEGTIYQNLVKLLKIKTRRNNATLHDIFDFFIDFFKFYEKIDNNRSSRDQFEESAHQYLHFRDVGRRGGGAYWVSDPYININSLCLQIIKKYLERDYSNAMQKERSSEILLEKLQNEPYSTRTKYIDLINYLLKDSEKRCEAIKDFLNQIQTSYITAQNQSLIDKFNDQSESDLNNKLADFIAGFTTGQTNTISTSNHTIPSLIYETYPSIKVTHPTGKEKNEYQSPFLGWFNKEQFLKDSATNTAYSPMRNPIGEFQEAIFIKEILSSTLQEEITSYNDLINKLKNNTKNMDSPMLIISNSLYKKWNIEIGEQAQNINILECDSSPIDKLINLGQISPGEYKKYVYLSPAKIEIFESRTILSHLKDNEVILIERARMGHWMEYCINIEKLKKDVEGDSLKHYFYPFSWPTPKSNYVLELASPKDSYWEDMDISEEEINDFYERSNQLEDINGMTFDQKKGLWIQYQKKFVQIHLHSNTKYIPGKDSIYRYKLTNKKSNKDL